MFNAYQKDFDIGATRDSDYIYGPSRPRTYTFGINWTLSLMKILSILILGLLLRLPVQAQEINWISFSALSDSLKVQPKPVFIFFHTDWCAYCRNGKGAPFPFSAVSTPIGMEENKDRFGLHF